MIIQLFLLLLFYYYIWDEILLINFSFKRGCVIGSGGQPLHPTSSGSGNGGLFLMNSTGQPLPPQVQTNSSSMGCDDGGGGGGGGNSGGGGKATPLLRCHTPGKTPPTPIVAASANGSGVAPLKTLPIQV